MTLWQIWIARHAEVIKQKPEGTQGTKAKIWHQMKLYLKFEWKNSCEGKERTDVELSKVNYTFHFDLGENEDIFNTEDWKVSIWQIPPKPNSRECVGRVCIG